MRVDRRTFLKIAGAGSASLALAACGTTAQQPAAEEEPAEEEPAADAEPVAVRTAALKGPTAMGLVRFMSEVDAGNLADNDYTCEIYAAPDEITPLIAKEGVDIAAVPATSRPRSTTRPRAASASSRSTRSACSTSASWATRSEASRTCAARRSTPPARAPRPSTASSTCSRRTASPWARTCRSSGRASTPSASRRSRPPRARPWRCCRSPVVTTAQAQNDKIRVALDLTEEWDRVQTGDETSSMITGVAVVRSAVADENPAAVDAFLEHYAESVDFVNETWQTQRSSWAATTSCRPRWPRRPCPSATSSA